MLTEPHTDTADAGKRRESASARIDPAPRGRPSVRPPSTSSRCTTKSSCESSASPCSSRRLSSSSSPSAEPHSGARGTSSAGSPSRGIGAVGGSTTRVACRARPGLRRRVLLGLLAASGGSLSASTAATVAGAGASSTASVAAGSCPSARRRVPRRTKSPFRCARGRCPRRAPARRPARSAPPRSRTNDQGRGSQPGAAHGLGRIPGGLADILAHHLAARGATSASAFAR